MKRWIVVALAACGSSSTAPEVREGSGSVSAPIPADAGDGVKRRAVPCFFERKPFSIALGHGDDPVVCSEGRCIDARAHAVVAAAETSRPPAWLRSTELRKHGEAWSACLGDDCKPLGPKLTAALDGSAVGVTFDRRAAVIRDQVWRIDQDRPIALTPPKQIFGPDPKTGKVFAVAVAANHLVVTWVSSTCVDPTQRMEPSCGRWGQLVDSAGTNQGEDLHGFDPHQVLQFDDDMFVVTSDFVAHLSLFDIATGKLHRDFASPRLGVGFKVTDTIRVRDGAIATLLVGAYGLVVVEMNADKTHPLELLYLDHIPYCRGWPDDE